MSRPQLLKRVHVKLNGVRTTVPPNTAETFFEVCGEAVIGIDSEGRVDAWNPAAERLFGWSSEEVMGAAPPAGIIAGAETAEVQVTTRDGSRLDLELRVLPRPSSGRFLVAHDRSLVVGQERVVSERIRYESRFRKLLEAAPDAIIEVDREGRIVLANRVAATLFGYSREELLLMNVDALVPDAIRGGHAKHRAGYWSNPDTRPMGRGLVLSGRRSDGSDIPVEISLSPVETEDGFRVTAIIRDVTERREAQEKIHTANLELEERNREVQRADRLKSEFLASMSHELRTPLHTIIGFTELLAEELEGPLNDKQKRFVTHVYNDSVHLLELINDILDLSKIESGRMDLDIRAVNAGELLGEIASGTLPVAGAKNLTIENRAPGLLMVLADSVRLREIFTNLLSNAIKFTPNGGSIFLDARSEGRDMIRFSVTDTGIGIGLENQAVIFEKFRQVSSTTRGVREGTGLGLAIVKHLVEMHGGTVEVESAPGEGSCFSFSIPADGFSDAARPHSKPCVLIIDDEPAARELIASYLTPLGIATEFAAGATGAVALAKEVRPDAITLDLMMPGRSGWRLLTELRTMPETKNTPILVISVLDRNAEALSLGASEYLQKPVKRETLLRALREHVPGVGAALSK